MDIDPTIIRKVQASTTVMICKVLTDAAQMALSNSFKESPKELYDELTEESQGTFQEGIKHLYLAQQRFAQTLAANPPPSPPTNGEDVKSDKEEQQ